MKISLLILIATVSLGCSTVMTVPVDLGPCPLPPELPTMSESQFTLFQALDPGVVQVLNKREDLLQVHIETLCNIIESTG